MSATPLVFLMYLIVFPWSPPLAGVLVPTLHSLMSQALFQLTWLSLTLAVFHTPFKFTWFH